MQSKSSSPGTLAALVHWWFQCAGNIWISSGTTTSILSEALPTQKQSRVKSFVMHCRDNLAGVENAFCSQVDHTVIHTSVELLAVASVRDYWRCQWTGRNGKMTSLLGCGCLNITCFVALEALYVSYVFSWDWCLLCFSLFEGHTL